MASEARHGSAQRFTRDELLTLFCGNAYFWSSGPLLGGNEAVEGDAHAEEQLTHAWLPCHSAQSAPSRGEARDVGCRPAEGLLAALDGVSTGDTSDRAIAMRFHAVFPVMPWNPSVCLGATYST